MERLYLKSIDILNLGPFEHEFFEFGLAGAIIGGENHTGKSSLLGVIDWCLEGGSDPTLVRHGPGGERLCDSGEATMTFSDGSTYWKRQHLPENADEKGEVDVKARGPQGEIKKTPAAWLAERVPKKSFSVESFLAAEPADQAEFLLKHVDISFSAEEVNALIETPVGKLAATEQVFPKVVGAVPLQRLNEIYDTVYADRAAINKQKRDLEGVISDLERTLPREPDRTGPSAEASWADTRDHLQQQITDIGAQIAAKESEIKLEAEQARNKEKRRIEDMIQDLRNQLTNFNSECDKAEAEAIREQTAELADRKAALSLELGTARANADRETEASGTRKAIAQRREAGVGLVSKEMRRTAVLEAIDKAKQAKLKELPIDGFDLKWQKRQPVIMIHGTPIGRLSGQEKIYLAVQCIQFGSGSLPLIRLEGAELTETYLDALVDACKRHEIQLFATFRKKEEPLNVEALT